MVVLLVTKITPQARGPQGWRRRLGGSDSGQRLWLGHPYWRAMPRLTASPPCAPNPPFPPPLPSTLSPSPQAACRRRGTGPLPPPCVRASLPPGPPRRRPCARVGAPCGCVSLDKGSETHPLFPHTPPPPPEAWSSLEARVWRAASAASAPNDDPLVAATGARCPLRRARQPSGDTGVGGASAVGRRPRQRFEATSASRRRRRATVRKGSGGPFPPPHVLFSCTSFLAHMRGPSDAASPRGHAQTPFCSRWSHYLTPLCGPSPPL